MKIEAEKSGEEYFMSQLINSRSIKIFLYKGRAKMLKGSYSWMTRLNHGAISGLLVSFGWLMASVLMVGCHRTPAIKANNLSNQLSFSANTQQQLSPNWNNVLIISIDTLRPDHLGCYGYQGTETSNIDQLAKEGVLFSSCYTPVPITLPSHATLMTGQYPLTHGVRDNGKFRLKEESTTLAELFQAKGYRTAAFVGSFVLDSRFGLNQGFEEYNDVMEEKKEEAEILYEEKRGEQVVDSAVNWLTKVSAQPFFLFIHCFDPHAPYDPPDIYKAEGQICADGGRSHTIPCYEGEINYVDDCLGRLFQKMKELGVYDRTLICFTADHGESLGEHAEPSHAIFVYDSTLHIPLIFRLPGPMAEGRVISSPASNVDIAPTILSLAGLDWSNLPMQGRPLLTNSALQASLLPPEQPLYCESYFAFYNHHWSPLQGVRTSEWKYVRAPKPELYNIKEDPLEIVNLYSQRKDQVQDMEQLLDKLKLTYSSKASSSEAMPLDRDTRKRLEHLGYIWTAPAEHFQKELKEYPDPKDMVVALTYYNMAAFHYLQKDYQQAIDLFGKSLQINANDLFSHFMIGFLYQKMDKFEQARDKFLLCLQIDPNYLDGLVQLGAVYYELGWPETALQYLNKALELDPELIEAYHNLGFIYVQSGKYDQAVEAYEEALKRDPDYSEILVGLASLYLKKKDYQSALGHIQRAMAKDEQNPQVYNVLGNIYLGQGKIKEAQEAIERALSLDAQGAEAHVNLAEIFVQLDDFTSAKKEIKIAEDLDPNMVKISNCLGTIAIKEDRYEEALSFFQKARSLEPASAEIWYNLGITYIHLNQLDQAEASFQESIKLDQDNVKSYFNLGTLFYRLRKVQEAIEAYQKALAIEPENTEVFFHLGIIYQESGEIEKAISIYQRLLTIDESYLNARIKLSLAYFAKGQIEAGVAECHRILAADPSNEVAHINLGLTFFQKGELDRAIEEYQKAIASNPNNHVSYYQIAYCYLWKKDIKKGLECLKEALRVNPEYQPARQLLTQLESNSVREAQ